MEYYLSIKIITFCSVLQTWTNSKGQTFYRFHVGRFPESESRLQVRSHLRKKRVRSYRILKMSIQHCEIITASGLYVVLLKWQNYHIYMLSDFKMQIFVWIYFFQTLSHCIALASLDLTVQTKMSSNTETHLPLPLPLLRLRCKMFLSHVARTWCRHMRHVLPSRQTADQLVFIHPSRLTPVDILRTPGSKVGQAESTTCLLSVHVHVYFRCICEGLHSYSSNSQGQFCRIDEVKDVRPLTSSVSKRAHCLTFVIHFFSCIQVFKFGTGDQKPTIILQFIISQKI